MAHIPLPVRLYDHAREAVLLRRVALLQGALALSALLYLTLFRLPLEGATSWRKPMLFAFATSLTALSLRWVIRHQPPGRALWMAVPAFAYAMSFETLLVTLQCARGVPSHFNLGTRLDAFVLQWMGLLAVVVAFSLVALTVGALRVAFRSHSHLCAALGMLGLTASVGIGYAMLSLAEGHLRAGLSAAEVSAQLRPLRHLHGAALHLLQAMWALDVALTRKSARGFAPRPQG